MAEITLIVPPAHETAATGFRLGAEKLIFRCMWRVEFWRTNPYPQIFKNGKKVSIADVPEHAARFVNSVRRDVLDHM